MFLIRKGSFETNSSSCHSITVVYKKPSNKDIDNCISLLRKHEQDGKIIIDLDERLKLGDGKDDHFGLEAHPTVKFTPHDSFTRDPKDMIESMVSVASFLGYGDLIGRLLMIFFSTDCNWGDLMDSGLTEVEFDWRVEDSPVCEYFYESEASIAIMSLSKYLQKPIVFRSAYGFDKKKIWCAVYHLLEDDRGLSLISIVGGDPLDFIFDSGAFLRSVTSEY